MTSFPYQSEEPVCVLRVCSVHVCDTHVHMCVCMCACVIHMCIVCMYACVHVLVMGRWGLHFIWNWGSTGFQ